MLPRQSDVDMHREGFQPAYMRPSMPSLNAEECTAHQISIAARPPYRPARYREVKGEMTWLQAKILAQLRVQVVARDELCRRFLEIPGVGPVTALTFATAIDDPHRFRRSRDVAAYFGLTGKRWQSGTSIDVKGRISKAGDADVRKTLYEAATVLLTRYKRPDRLKEWGQKLSKAKSHPKACVAVARKLAVIMHAMWKDGTCYEGAPESMPADLVRKLTHHEPRAISAVL